MQFALIYGNLDYLHIKKLLENTLFSNIYIYNTSQLHYRVYPMRYDIRYECKN